MMQGYQGQRSYAQGYGENSAYNGWNYSLFGYNDYGDHNQAYWGQHNYNYNPENFNWSPPCNDESSTNKLKNEAEEVVTKEAPSSNMLKAKRSGRVFYPSKVTHSRHNSQDNQTKGAREDLSPLNRSHDST